MVIKQSAVFDLPTLGTVHEFDYTPDDFERVRHLIYGKAGISLNESKAEMVYSRLARRVRDLQLSSVKEYLDDLEANGGENEWQAFVNALTTNLTSFFREQHHFPMLAELLKSKRGQPLTIWCAAASTGEEPYSIAITAIEALGSAASNVKILATDVDTGVLETASRGVYAMERVERMSPERLKRFFLRGSGANAGHVRVRDELRNMIVYRRVNLLDDNWPVRAPIEAIFARNVMIYFDRKTQLSIIEKMVPVMSETGLLFTGHSESLHHASHLVRLKSRTVYEAVPNSGIRRQPGRAA